MQVRKMDMKVKKNKIPEDLTLNGLKHSMQLSLAHLDKPLPDPLNFTELVHGYSERIQDMADDLVQQQINEKRDAAMMKKIADNKIKR
jgi:hypothetical protein